jgi:hypothetical protein
LRVLADEKYWPHTLVYEYNGIHGQDVEWWIQGKKVARLGERGQCRWQEIDEETPEGSSVNRATVEYGIVANLFQRFFYIASTVSEEDSQSLPLIERGVEKPNIYVHAQDPMFAAIKWFVEQYVKFQRFVRYNK